MSNTVSRYSDTDLAEFQALIESKIAKTQEQVEVLQKQIMEITENSGDEFGGDWVDDSSTSSDMEMLNNMAIRQRRYLQDLENAMVRIRNKTYGICTVTGELIEKERLLAVPITTKSAVAKNLRGKPEAKSSEEKKRTTSAKRAEKKVITRVIRKSNPNTDKSSEQKTKKDDLEDIESLLDDNLGLGDGLIDLDEIPEEELKNEQDED